MKKTILVVPFIILSLGVSTVYADQIYNKKEAINQINSLSDISARIKQSQEYLEKLPTRLDRIKKKFKELTSMGEEIEIKISHYLKFMDSCSTRELKHKGKEQCDMIMRASLRGHGFNDILNMKREQIKDAIEYIKFQRNEIKSEISEADVVKEGVVVMNDVLNILDLDI
jgi:hypothetical protein